MTNHYHGLGVYGCYCLKYSSVTDAFNLGHICQQYRAEKSTLDLLQTFQPAAIAILNNFLKNVSAFIIKKIGYHTKGQEMSSIQTAIFFT